MASCVSQCTSYHTWLPQSVLQFQSLILSAGLTNSLSSHVAPSTTFYSLDVWYHGDVITEWDWNPGNFDPHLGLDIAEYVEKFVHRAPAGSALREELERRYELLMGAVRKMEFGTEHAWWDCDPLLNSSRSNTFVLARRDSPIMT